jgi:hypothetical protein
MKHFSKYFAARRLKRLGIISVVVGAIITVGLRLGVALHSSKGTVPAVGVGIDENGKSKGAASKSGSVTDENRHRLPLQFRA